VAAAHEDFSLPASAGAALPTAVRAEGIRVWDREGNEYLDACGGAMVTLLGHRHPRLVAAAKRQLDQMTFSYRFSFSNEPMVELAELIREISPMPRGWSFFNSSGSESVESAIHLALLYWQYRGRPEKVELIGRVPGFHGSTLGALSLSGSKWRKAFDHVLAPNAVAETPGADIRARRTPEEACRFGLQELERAIEARGAQNVAAVFLEPITGASAAAVVPPDGYLQGVRDLCDRHDVLLVADETITGFGRTGCWWASDHWGVAPDVTTFAKGVTSGIVPFSGMVVAEPVAQVLTAGGGFPYGHTFSGNPLGCAVAAESIRVIRDEDLLGRANQLGAHLRQRLDEIAAASPHVGEIRGRGLLLGLELVEDRSTLTPLAGGAARLRQLAFERGLMIYACPTPLRDTMIEAVLLAPPLVVTDDDVEQVVERLATSLAAVGRSS
jgi:adenosylmethionine-8-amino-7-oxononanoate aminotransferase